MGPLKNKLSLFKTKTYKKNNTKDENIEVMKWKIALENSTVGLWDWNTIENKVFYSSETKSLIGYLPNEIKSSEVKWDERVHPEDKASYFQDFEAHINGDLEHYKNEHRIRCKDGSYKWILDRGKVVYRDENNKPTRIIGTHVDITQRKKNEALLKKNLQLITNQNKRLHNFTHIVSHNLKTHIGNFKNILEFYDEASSQDEKEEMITHLRTISEALTNTIVDLNAIISIKSKSTINELNEVINIHDCAEKIIKSLKLESSKNNVIIHNAIRKNDALKTNASYFESILYNLISNGIKYKQHNRNAKIILQTIHTNTTLKLLVSDNGIGIDLEKHQHQLFEMYQTFHGTDRTDSRGIGLYITKTQMEALGGTIEVDSKLNEGTTFTLIFKKQKALE